MRTSDDFDERASVICPHCGVHFSPKWKDLDCGGGGNEPAIKLTAARCLGCAEWVIYLHETRPNPDSYRGKQMPVVTIWPRRPKRPLAHEVPASVKADFDEAVAILEDSPKGSAAVSRGLLQYILREAAKVKRSDLANEIQEVIDRGTLPTHLSAAIDAVRTVGNFAAHPIKSTNSGQIVAVEPGESEWLLDTLEALIDFYYVQPAKLEQQRTALNSKLAAAGKPLLKG